MSGPRRVHQPPPLPDDLAFVLIDGDNLLHRVRGGRDEGAIRWLLPRLREWRPDGVRIVLMLDGHPEPGESFRRQVVTGIESHYSGNVDADTALIKLLSSRPYEDRIRTVLVTDDRQLSDRARHVHAFVRRLDWFVGQLASGASAELAPRKAPSERPAGVDDPIGSAAARPQQSKRRSGARQPGGAIRPTGVGAGKPPKRVAGMVGGDPSRESDGEPEKTPWKPGRGATKKTGNPKRGHPPD
ncbi:MAG: hypothetical protein U0869_11045 [Chloroflexota bacterium]